MASLTTSTSHDAAQFATIAARNPDLAGALHCRVVKAALGGSATHREHHMALGKLRSCDRVHRFIDSGAPCLEIGQLATNGMYDDGGPVGVGVIGGID